MISVDNDPFTFIATADCVRKDDTVIINDSMRSVVDVVNTWDRDEETGNSIPVTRLMLESKSYHDDGEVDMITFSRDHEVEIRTPWVSEEILDPITLSPCRWFVNVYEVDRAYGGPEEGGWWYDVGSVIRVIPCSSYDIAVDVRERASELFPNTGRRSSVLGGEDYSVCIEETPGKDYPESRPHYE